MSAENPVNDLARRCCWLWQMEPTVLEQVFDAALADPPRIGFANDAAILPAQNAFLDKLADAGAEAVSFAGLPTIELVLNMPGFAPDCFAFGGFDFVSAPLREALALDGNVVEYLPVNTQGARPEVVAQDYRIMSPLFVRPLIDLSRTRHEIVPMQRRDGAIDDRVLLDPEAPQYWRDDFVADVPLFRAAHSNAIIVDDELATRILAAGITDVVFQDIAARTKTLPQ